MVYEDLVNYPIATLTQLYEKLDLPVDLWSARALEKHLDDLPSSIRLKNNYMSQYRGSQHDENAWMNKMNQSAIENIEVACMNTMLKFGYKPAHILKYWEEVGKFL